MTHAQATRQQGRGWERIVERVNEATDQETFLAGMLQLQCMIVAADYGAIWLVDDQNKPQLAETWPTTIAERGPASSVIQMLGQAAENGLSRSSSQILKLHIGDEETSQGAPRSLVFVTLIRCHGKIVAASTAVSESRDTKIAKITQPMRELAAGLFEGFQAKRDARAFQNDADNVRRAMALLAVSQEARGFKGACFNLVNELARQQQCSRVSLGWIRGKSVRAVAMSDTEHLKRHDEQVALIELAMSECLDQQQPIVAPLDDQSDPLLAHAVIHAHRRLTGDHPNKYALSIPLRHGDEHIGVVTLERSDAPFDAQMVQKLQLVADVMAPHLHDRKQGDRFLITHSWHSVRHLAGYLVGPKHVGWKLLGVAVAGLIAFVIFGTWPYHISAPFTLEAIEKRIVPTPYDGRLDTVRVEPGARVQAETLLAQLDTTEFRLQLAEATGQIKMTTLEKTQATAEGKQAEAQQAQARLEQTQARITLLRYRIEQANIRSPIGGFVLSGDWYDKIGGVIEQGKPMFEIAPLEELVAIVRVSESDIDQINEPKAYEGQLATRSVPEEKFAIRVTRIVPMATPTEGTNAFEVRCRIDDPAPWLRPGMEGLARIKIGERRIIWILTHRVINTVRLWLWL